MKKDYEFNKRIKITIIFFAIFILAIFLYFTFLGIKQSDKPTSKIIKIKDITNSVRGSIVTSDNFNLATSKTIFQVSIYKKYLDPSKTKLFIDLFSKYTDIDPNTIQEKLLENDNKVILSRNITYTQAKALNKLKYDLQRLEVFKPIKKGGIVISLDISKFKKIRDYPLNDTLTPYLGYIRYDKDGEPFGIYGLEHYYDNLLKNTSDKILSGQRDRQGVIIRDKKNHLTKKEDGFDIITNIILPLQKSVENILDKQKKQLQSTEVIAAIMDTKTGKLISIASSNRYNPSHIVDVSTTNISAIRYIYEPGSVIKPIFFSILLENKKIHLDEIINTHNGRYRLTDGHIIKDEERFPFLPVQDIITYSSNVGMTELSKRSNPLMLIDWFHAFGFAKKSGIDLSYELSGSIPDINELKNSIILSNLSFGYKIRANFFQLLKAYNIFNNDGKIVTPKIANIKVNNKNKLELIQVIKTKQVLSKTTAHIMNKILQKVVRKGTGKVAITPGLTIGGKTGTAQITDRGHYIQSYNSSFFGFANDKFGHKYTIGVLVIKPKFTKHFASQSAAPTFKKIVDILIKQGFLKPSF